MEICTIRLPKQLKSELELIAKKKDRTLSYIVRKFLIEKTKEHNLGK